MLRDLDIGEGLVVSAQLLRTVTSRSGGPGGQNVNKVETRVTVELELASLQLSEEQHRRVAERLATRITKDGVLRVTSQADRTQLGNRDRALARMEELLRDALRPPKKRTKTRPTRASRERRLDEKKQQSHKKKLRAGFD